MKGEGWEGRVLWVCVKREKSTGKNISTFVFLEKSTEKNISTFVFSVHSQQHPNKEVSLIFTGDFNSTPEFEVYRLMTSQMAGFDDIDWADSKPL